MKSSKHRGGKYFRSSCCGAELRVKGVDGETRWYECVKCKTPSDPEDEQWCKKCVSWGDHTSANCPGFK